jgi:hypothetical protein
MAFDIPQRASTIPTPCSHGGFTFITFGKVVDEDAIKKCSFTFPKFNRDLYKKPRLTQTAVTSVY